MAYFLPSYFQKRILRYALSRLDLLDADQLNLDNLDVAWGRRSVVELRDVGVQLKKLASLLNLPTSVALVKVNVRLLRITIPADLYNSGIVAEVTGVEVHLSASPVRNRDTSTATEDSNTTQTRDRRATDQPRSIRPKIHDPGGASSGLASPTSAKGKTTDSGVLPTTDELAKSFLQTEPREEKAQLKAAVEQSQHLDQSQVDIIPNDTSTLGVGDGLSLPAFLSGFLKGIGDRFRLTLSDVRVDISLQVDLPSESCSTSSASERSEKVTLRLSVKDIQYGNVQFREFSTGSEIDRSNNAASTESMSNTDTPKWKSKITLSDVRGAVLSDASMLSSLSRSFAPSSSSESTPALSPSRARRRIHDPIKAPTDGVHGTNENAALYPSMADNLHDSLLHNPPLGSSGILDSSSESDSEHQQPTVSRDTHFETVSHTKRDVRGSNIHNESSQPNKVIQRSIHEGLYEHPHPTEYPSADYPENPSRKPEISLKSWQKDTSISKREGQKSEELLGSSRSSPSSSPDMKTSANIAHEDLAESRIFSHEEAESMYMSAMTDVSSPKDSINPTMPGAWDSHLKEITENIAIERSTNMVEGPPSPRHISIDIGSADMQRDDLRLRPAKPSGIDTQTPRLSGTDRIDKDIDQETKPQDSNFSNASEPLQAAYESPLIISKTFVLIDHIFVHLPLRDADLKSSCESQTSAVHNVSPKTPSFNSESAFSVDIGAAEFRSDMSLARLTALAIRQLRKDLSVSSSNEREGSDAVKDPKSKFQLSAGDIAWKFYDRVLGQPVTESSLLSPRGESKDSFLESELLLRANIQGLNCTSQSTTSAHSFKAAVTKLVFGYANGVILAFDSSVRMRESTRDILAPSDKDFVLNMSTDARASKIEVSTLPVSIRLDLRRLDETFAWLGGFSSILDLSNSMISSITKSDPTKPQSKESRRSKRGVHFESPGPGQPIRKENLQGHIPRKVTARIGGLLCVLEGTEASLRLEGTALKVVSRAEGLAMQMDRLHGTGLYLNSTTDEPTIVAQLSNIRMEFVSMPSEVDLARLVALSSPSNDSYENDEDEILLETLLRQRRQGGVVRFTAERTENHISNVDDLRQLSTLLDELKKLGTVAKYLPEDDRPGILVLVLLRQYRCEAYAGQSLGSFISDMKAIEIAHVTFPSLFALGISNAVICRNNDEELLGPAFVNDDRTQGSACPMFMARFIGNEMEPTIKLKLKQVRMEYHVAFVLAIMGMNDDTRPEELLSEVAGSIATLTKSQHGIAEAPVLSQDYHNPHTKPTPTTTAIRVDVTIRDSVLGLNPRNSPAKGLLVLTRTHFTGVIPEDSEINAVLDIQKATFMIINDTENIQPQGNHQEVEPSRSLISLVHELEYFGYISVSSISAARVSLRIAHDQQSSNKFIDVEVKDDLFVLETCADSTQTLQSILNGLLPPLPPNKENRYRTEVIPIEDMLSSFSGIAFSSNGEQAEDDADEMENDDGSQELERLGGLYESEYSRQSGSIADSMLDDPESVLVDRSTEDLKGPLTDPDLQPQRPEEFKGPPLEFREDHFGGSASIRGNAHGWNTQHVGFDLGNEPVIQENPLRVRVRDVHVIWNLFDGYDWQYTRDTIGKAIVDVESKALERLSKREKWKAQEVEDDEESVIGDFLFNSIYIGISANRDPRSLSYQVHQNVNDIGSETDSSAPSTMTSSPSHQGFPSSWRNKKMRLARSKHHKMTFELKGISADVLVFPPGSGETQSSIDIRVQDLDVFDHVPTSTWKKFATYMYDVGERESGTSMIHLEVLNVRPVPDLAASEMILKATILPVRLHVDQDALDFLTRFFEFKDDAAPRATSKAEAIFLQRVEINSVRLKLDFKPKRVDYAGIRSGHTNEFMNFFILDRADMVLRHVIIYGISGFDRLGKTLNDIWMPDIKKNQLPGVLAGLAPVRSLVNVGGGVRDLVLVPMREYQKDGRVVRSLQRGALAFARTTTGELVKLGAKLAIGTQTVLQGAEDLLTHAEVQQMEAVGGWEDAGLEEGEKKHISLYADQPLGVIHGLRGAYASLERDLVTAKDAIVAMPGEVMESGTAGGAARAVLKGAPTIILRPALGVSKAVGQTLMGATNSLDPANRRRIEEKYKKH